MSDYIFLNPARLWHPLLQDHFEISLRLSQHSMELVRIVRDTKVGQGVRFYKLAPLANKI